MSKSTIRIGGASGYWGDASLAVPQLLQYGRLDFLVFDYLAEITMSLLARAKSVDNSKGYATDFVSVIMAENLPAIAASGVKVIANAGGVNVSACAEAVRQQITDLGLNLKVATVTGDDLVNRAADFTAHTEMFSGEAFPELEKIASINAYLGAFPVASALDGGADIVITGRCVDSAVTLAACIHHFGWQAEHYDLLAQGSLAGHLIECGTQASGGNFTDWEALADKLDNAGYPIVEIQADGVFTLSKPDNTHGLVSVGTVVEQMLYEIGDPGAYVLPDVICDFTQVKFAEVDKDKVEVSGARGLDAPDTYKVSLTWADGFRAGHIWTMVGRAAVDKAQCFADTVFKRVATALKQKDLPPLLQTSVEIIGAESHFGAQAQVQAVREVDVKIAARHESAKGIAVFLKEMTGLALTAPPGLTGFAGARAKPSPVVRLFSFLLAKSEVVIKVDGKAQNYLPPKSKQSEPIAQPQPPAITLVEAMTHVPLEALAWGRSGDKGDKANIGIIARHAELLPWIAHTLTEEYLANLFTHFLQAEQAKPVRRYYLPGCHALNFVLNNVLGGGGIASLRNDPQGKGYAQLLLCEPIPIPEKLLALQAIKPIYA